MSTKISEALTGFKNQGTRDELVDFGRAEWLAIHNALVIAAEETRKKAEMKSSTPYRTGLALELNAYEQLAGLIAASYGFEAPDARL